jgi:crossover junction endodeoxyribonuclease RusA
MILTLPYPPTVNTYYRNVGSRVLLSAKGRAYRKRVALECIAQRAKRIDGPLAVRIVAHPPDRRRRDIDNLLKSSLDSMQYAGLFEDDALIADLRILRGEVETGGRLLVSIEAMLKGEE